MLADLAQRPKAPYLRPRPKGRLSIEWGVVVLAVLAAGAAIPFVGFVLAVVL